MMLDGQTLTCKGVGDVVLHLHVHEEGRQRQQLVLLVPQVDVVITWRGGVSVEKGIN